MFLEDLVVRWPKQHSVARQGRPLGQGLLDGTEIAEIPGPGAQYYQAFSGASHGSQHRLAQLGEALQKPQGRMRAGHLALMREQYLGWRVVDRAERLPVSDARGVPSQFPSADHARGHPGATPATAEIDLLYHILKGPVPG
jgi:hypothetical protein